MKSALPQSERWLLVVIANSDGNNFRNLGSGGKHTIADLATSSGLSPRGVRRGLASLRRAGFLAYESARGRTTNYVVTVLDNGTAPDTGQGGH